MRVTTPQNRMGPGGEFQYRVARQIMGRHTQRQVCGSWDYPPPSTGDGDSGGRIQRDGGIFAKEEEYGCEIHHNTTNCRPLKGEYADDRDVGEKKVVGTGGPGTGGIKGGVSGRREEEEDPGRE